MAFLCRFTVFTELTAWRRANMFGLGIMGFSRVSMDACVICDSSGAPMMSDALRGDAGDGARLEAKGTRFDDIPWADHRRPQAGCSGGENRLLLEPGGGDETSVLLEGEGGVEMPKGGIGLREGELWVPRSISLEVEMAVEAADAEGRDLIGEAVLQYEAIEKGQALDEVMGMCGFKGDYGIVRERRGWLKEAVAEEGQWNGDGDVKVFAFIL